MTACVMRDIRAASGEAASCEPRAASSVGVGKRAKRETALVSYNDLDATLTGRIIHTLTVLTDSGVKLFFAGNRIFICKMR